MTSDHNVRHHQQLVRLADICSLVTERVPAGSASRLRVDLEHIESGTGLLTDDAVPALPEGTRIGFERNDVLFGKLRPYLRKTHLASEVGECSTEIWVIRARTELVNPRYLHCVLRSQAVQRLANATSGTKMPRADWEHVAEAPIWLPVSALQDQIAHVDVALERSGRLLTQAIAAKREQKRGLMQQLLTGKVRFPGFTEPWKTVPLGEVLTESRITGSTGAVARKITIKLYGKGVYAKVEKRPGSENTRYFRRCAGQLIYSKLDCLNGAFGIVPPELDGFESTLDMPAFDVRSNTNSEWLLAVVGRPSFYSRFKDGADGSRKAQRVDPTRFLAERISLPTRAEQDRVSAINAVLTREIDLLVEQRIALASQRRGLMERLLSGDLVIPPSETSAA